MFVITCLMIVIRRTLVSLTLLYFNFSMFNYLRQHFIPNFIIILVFLSTIRGGLRPLLCPKAVEQRNKICIWNFSARQINTAIFPKLP